VGVEEGGSGSREAAEAGRRASGMRVERVSVFYVSGAGDIQMSPNVTLCSVMFHSATVPKSHNGRTYQDAVHFS